MQFTGLTDRNGKEIYEGDVVLCGDDNGSYDQEYDEAKDEFYDVAKRQVVWAGEDSYPAFTLRMLNGDVDEVDCDVNPLGYLAEDGRMEVIGNIYENPELRGA